jgi:hypothetical protein
MTHIYPSRIDQLISISRVLQEFLRGRQSNDNTVLTAITVRTVYFSVTVIHGPWIGTQRSGSHGTEPEISVQCEILLPKQ